MRKITQTIVGTTPPLDKNVLWLDTTNSNSPVEKVFLNGEWIPTTVGDDYYTKDEVDTNISNTVLVETERATGVESNLSDQITALQTQDIEVVDTLPVSDIDPKKIYRVQGATSYTDYMYQDSDWKELATYSFPGIDDTPTLGSNNLVKSGGVQNELALGAVYDVSAKNPTAGPNNDGKWESLSALLSDANLGTLIPISIRKGGMSIKFVQSSDNSYVQFRYMSSSTANADFTNVANWQGVDDEPTAGSDNIPRSGGVFKSILDLSNGLFLKGLLNEPLNNTFYKADLSMSSSVGFICKKIDVSTCAKIVIKAALRASAAISLTDTNNNILWQKIASDMPENAVVIDLSTYSSAKYLYFTSDTNLLPLDNTFVVGYIDSMSLVKMAEKINTVNETLNLIDSTPTASKDKQKNILLRENKGSVAEPNWQNISEVVIPVATSEVAGLMSPEDKDSLSQYSEEQIEMTMADGNFYRNDLSMSSSASFECAIVNLSKKSEYDGVIINAAPRSGAYCSLVDSNNTILWQSNNASDFPKNISFADYPTASKIYFSNEKSVVTSPYVKYYGTKTIIQIVEDVKNETESLENEVAVIENSIINNISKKEIISNSFDSDNIVSLPEDFGVFGIPIQISRKVGGIIGWNINPSAMQKDNAQSATYFVSPDGNDSNSGLTESAPLKTIDAALGKSDVNTIILTDGIYLNGVNFTAGLQINKEINIIGVNGRTIIKSAAAQSPIKILSAVYISDVVFDGGTAALQTNLAEELCIFNRCKFLNSSSTNGIDCLGGKYIMNECEASNNMRDGFNYHGSTISNVSYKPQVVEINCYGFNNGTNHNSYINNGSTLHESGSKIIRIYCKYGTSKGVVVADADGCSAINFGVVAYSTQNLDGDDNRKSCFGSQGSYTKVWLYDCSAFGSKYDIIVDSNSYIYRTSPFAKEYAASGGTIGLIE